MIRNYLKTAFRSLVKNKGFTAINILGLTVGIATCLLIVFYVWDELSYDRYNQNADRIFRVNNDIKFAGNENAYATAPAPAAFALKADFPEIQQVTRIHAINGLRLKKGNQVIREDKVAYADSTLFDVFTLPMTDGDPAAALRTPNSIVIDERTALKYFSRTNVVGETLTTDQNTLYKITGVIKDIPEESHFNFDFLISMSSEAASREDAWFSNDFNTYILLRPGAGYKTLQAKFPAFLTRHAGPQLQSILHVDFDALERSGSYFRFSLIPLTKIHLESKAQAELSPAGSITFVYIFTAIAIFILLIACINFMNLSTARSANRAREVGVRKVLGSPRKYLVAQFLTESVLLTLAGAFLAVLAAWALLPLFNTISGKDLVVSYRLLGWLAPCLALFVLIIGCLAGSYPAFFLSAFQPIDVLKGHLSRGFKGSALRSFLVVFQFAISIFLISGTLVVYHQLKFIQSRDIGFDRSHVLVVSNVGSLGNQAKTFQHEIRGLSAVENATMTGSLPTDNFFNSTTYFKDRGLDQKQALHAQEWWADENYIPTLGMTLESGRNFSAKMGTDSNAVIINDAAAKALQLEGYGDPLNKTLFAPEDNLATVIQPYHIIGVIRDFNFRSLRQEVTPLVLHYAEDRGAVSIRIRADADIPTLIAGVREKWKALSPNQDFVYSFMDQDFDKLYRAEQRVGKIFFAFTLFAIMIACLGLFGLAAYAAEQRTKEIGIRKVLGAGISTIVGMLSKDFIRLVAVAILIATPLSWWAGHKWLEGFAYRQEMRWWIFVLAGLAAVLIAFVTISFQAIKAALTNPVKSLKSE